MFDLNWRVVVNQLQLVDEPLRVLERSDIFGQHANHAARFVLIRGEVAGLVRSEHQLINRVRLVEH